MRPLDGIRIGITSLLASWLRSSLSILGVVIGVGTLVVMISIGEGTKRQIVQSVEAMGSNLILIDNSPAPATRTQPSHGLTLRDARLLTKHCHLARAVVPLKMTSVRASFGGRTTPFLCQGTTADLPAVANLTLAGGRFLCHTDVEQSAKVCVIGARVPDRLGLRDSLLNQLITLNGQAFLVVGVVQKKGITRIINPDICIFIPITVCQEMSQDRTTLSRILVQGLTSPLVHRTKQEISRLMNFFHQGTTDFSLWAQDELLEKQKKVTETLQKALAAIALIALIIAGIGIMNVLLASVSERIKEIGIRKALGANPTDVLVQFLWESLLLTFTGGTIGIIAGIAAGNWICKLLTVHLPQAQHQWIAVTSPQSVFISFGFALVTGLFFGLYPAVKAAKLDPCQALAYQ